MTFLLFDLLLLTSALFLTTKTIINAIEIYNEFTLLRRTKLFDYKEDEFDFNEEELDLNKKEEEE